ncbi:MAG: universal stress protein [Limimaricola sp.]|uniref:universal stress protein n=1 Tax=Limimaricola sp. TaxID=2211665 RepID=UPI001D6EF80E|nr:universal stress protein [Limimaricola sp.]MBI1415832.1 universal stress protein [Limimaricola sp.]
MYKNILVPVAYDHDHSDLQPLEVVRLLADAGARVTLLHVMDEVPNYAISYMPEDFRIKAREAIYRDLEARASAIPGCEARVIDGTPGSTILDFAGEHGVDLIVIASHRPGMRDYFLGSTAARVVRHADCAVHVLR